MQKASRAELKALEKIRGDRIGGICEPARRKLMRWAADSRAELSDADPEVPQMLEARQADVWRALLAIADLAGGDWPSRTRAAAMALAGVSQEESDYGLLLLEDMRTMFGSDAAGSEKLPSARIILELAKMEDRPWPEYRHDKPITTPQLAKLLGRFGIKPKNIRIPVPEVGNGVEGVGEVVVKGYERGDCAGAFALYLPATSDSAATAATSPSAVTVVAAVAAQTRTPTGAETPSGRDVAAVAAETEVPLREDTDSDYLRYLAPADLVPTIEIVHPEGAGKGTIVINARDFDPAVHVRADAAYERAEREGMQTDA